MISKAQVKFIRLLHQKKYRKAHLMFIAEGTKIAHDILNSPLKVDKIYATAAWLAKNTAICAKHSNTEINEVSQDELEKISTLSTPQEVLLLVHIPVVEPDIEINGDVSLAVESIRDPGNLGTIIRICDWYGINRLFCSDDCADAYNPKTVQATMGSIARVEVVYTSLSELIKKNKGVKSYAATLRGNLNVHTSSVPGPALLIIGNEAHGISEELLSCTDDTIMIPRFGEAESLNASIAAAVLVDNMIRLLKD
jgi:TrmH family RNA methyltransferase